MESTSIMRAEIVLVEWCASFTRSRRHGECIPTSHGPVNGPLYAGERPAEKGLNRTLTRLIGVFGRSFHIQPLYDDADLVIIGDCDEVPPAFITGHL